MATTNPVKKIPLKKIFGSFDKTNPDDMIKLTTLIQEKAAQNPEFKGYSVLNVDDDGMYALIAPMNYSVEEDNNGVKIVGIDVSRGGDIGAQKRTVAQMEAEHPGYSVTDFTRPEPSKCYVRLEQLDDKTISTRRIFAAVLGVKPWQIRISRTPENGWRIRIKEGATTYSASKYDSRMQEAVETIGRKGWFFKADPETGVIIVYPGKEPTFPKVIPMPTKLWKEQSLRRSYFGMKLPDLGRETGENLYNDWKDAPGVLVSGASNGGKSVVINSLLYYAVAGGCQLVICDDADKSADFNWCRPWVMDKGWGCDGIEYCAAALRYVLELCSKRADIIKQHGKMNWWGLPDNVKKENPPILLICDEIAQWAAPIVVPPGLEKDNPDRISMEYERAIHASSFRSLKQISQKARFAGIFFLYSTQSATAQNGLDPSVRLNLASKIIVGAKVQDSVRDNVLNDARKAPKVPDNVIKEGRAIGTGVAELVNQEACVYKGFYEDDKKHGKEYSDILREHLEKICPPRGDDNSGHWTWNEVVKTVYAAAEKPDEGDMYEDDAEDEASDRLKAEGGFGVDGRDVAEHDAPLKGAARAAHMSAIESAKLEARNAAAKGM